MPWKTRYNEKGKLIRYWEPFRMPRWSSEIVDSICFMYPTAEDAELGKSIGGTGFLVGVHWESDPSKSHIYVVTNYHVAVCGGASVIRLNTRDGKSAVIETDPSEWFWQFGHDVAVHRIDWTNVGGANVYDFKFFEFTHMDLTNDIISKYNIGIGDEVVSPGRFVDFNGAQKNEPLIRSGIVSLMGPSEIATDKDIPWSSEPVHVVEMRSRSGFSGSPVYVYLPILAQRIVDTEIEVDPWKFHGPWLLGVYSGQFPMFPQSQDINAFGTSMGVVVPCSVLSDLLLRDQAVVEERKAREDAYQSSPKIIAEVSAHPATEENPLHREAFKSLVDAAVKTPRQDD